MKFKDKQSVREYLNGSKIYVNGKSEEIQKVLLSYGFNRKDESIEDECVVKEVGNTHHPFIFIAHYNYFFYTGYDMDHFHDYHCKELKAEDVLSIEIEKPQFKPFDKVLTLDSENRPWRIDFFEKYDSKSKYPYICLRNSYRYCLPYEGNESLLGKPYNHEDEK